MFTDESIKVINTLQERVEYLERQTKALAGTQKSILQHLREVIMIVAENSEEPSEE